MFIARLSVLRNPRRRTSPLARQQRLVLILPMIRTPQQRFSAGTILRESSQAKAHGHRRACAIGRQSFRHAAAGLPGISRRGLRQYQGEFVTAKARGNVDRACRQLQRLCNSAERDCRPDGRADR